METIKLQWRKLRDYLAATSGVSTVEYALIVVAVIAIVGVGVASLGGSFNNLFDELASDMAKAASITASKATG
ncbi:MAG: Flp family type IVb pilin [Gammaproteobacteria bacterium]|nr:Flp family type IVb pilin [Gammaproteobacteria bacterium]